MFKYTRHIFNSDASYSHEEEGLLINIFSDNGVYKAAVLPVDKSYGSGYNSICIIVNLDELSIYPEKE